jgi:phosphate transport system protein
VARAVDLVGEDDEMDQLRRQLFTTMLTPDWPHGVAAAVDIALLGRYYERIADHSVSMARRVIYLVTGDVPSRTA